MPRSANDSSNWIVRPATLGVRLENWILVPTPKVSRLLVVDFNNDLACRFNCVFLFRIGSIEVVGPKKYELLQSCY